MESAVKLVRQYWREAGKPDKYKVISRWSSFHGNTTGALALGGHTARRSHYLPIFQHTPHIEPSYCYRCGVKEIPETCDLQCADELERCIKHEDPESVGAFIAEPVVGATAGAVVPKEGYWQRIRQICDEYNIKLIADEVMTGIGRCGRNFGIDNWDIVPKDAQEYAKKHHPEFLSAPTEDYGPSLSSLALYARNQTPAAPK